MTTTKKNSSPEQKTQTTNEAEYIPPDKNEFKFSTDLTPDDSTPVKRGYHGEKYPVTDENVKLLSLFLPSTSLGPDNIWNTPITYIIDLLIRFGVPSDHLRVSLVTLLTMNSAHLGNPLALELIDDSYAGATEIMRICADLTPQQFLLNLSGKITLDILLKESEKFKGRAIIGVDSEVFEKVKEIINLLLKNQNFIHESTFLSPFGNVPLKTEIKGPTACVLMTKNPKKLILNHPSFFKCYLQPSSQPIISVSELSQQDQQKLTYDSALMKRSLGRLQDQQVTIPYSNQIIEHLQNSGISRDKIATFLRMLRVITIINNSPPLTAVEFISKFHEIDPITVSAVSGLPTPSPKELVAKKVDYYICWKLLSGLIQNEEIYVTERQKRIFEVIKKHNEIAVDVLPIIPKPSKIEKLNIIAGADASWDYIDQINVEINSDGGIEVAQPTVYKDLQELKKAGLIEEKKSPGKTKIGYHVTTWEIAETIQLPRPEDIDHPVMKEKIKIVDPLTGTVDEV
ncbi:MAG: hypothetical protein LLG97_02255 [Deltaproteobacteria bacterium]|nr:hypothetical protein [Deltaproteobacteria bacterium]